MCVVLCEVIRSPFISPIHISTVIHTRTHTYTHSHTHSLIHTPTHTHLQTWSVPSACPSSPSIPSARGFWASVGSGVDTWKPSICRRESANRCAVYACMLAGVSSRCLPASHMCILNIHTLSHTHTLILTHTLTHAHTHSPSFTSCALSTCAPIPWVS
jgi:hypothetical protein